MVKAKFTGVSYLNLVLQALCAPFGKNQSYFIPKNVLLRHFIAATLLYDPFVIPEGKFLLDLQDVSLGTNRKQTGEVR